MIPGRPPDEGRLLAALEPHADLARAFILWHERLGVHPDQCLSVHFQRGYDMRERFVDMLCARDSHLYRDDAIDRVHGFMQALGAFAKEGHAILPLLYWMLPRPAKLAVRFIDSLPFVDCREGRYSDWLLLVSDMDPDALVTLELARRLGRNGAESERAADFERWPQVYHDGDNDLRRLLARGVSDLHLHLKSANPVAVLWRRICARPSLLDTARAFAKQSFGTHSATSRARTEDRTVIERGLDLTGDAGLPLLEDDAGQGCFDEVADEGNARFQARHIGPLMAPYRHAMTRSWQRLFGPQDAARDALERALDHYLVAKQRFRGLQLQSLRETNPGLSAFDVVRKRGSHLGRFYGEEAGGTRFDALRFVFNNGLLVRALESDPHLRIADMRIAPPSVSPSTLGRAYAKTGLGLARLRDLGGLEGGSAVHFKRAHRNVDAKDEDLASYSMLHKLREYDLETAGLQLMRARLRGVAADRTDEGDRALAMLWRVDLASPERGAGPDRIAPYIRLLRGHLPTYQALLRLPDNAPFVARWQALAREGIAHPDPLAPRLGLTVHAGEDFDTLVQGLYHINRAIETWRLEPGEGLGHCLALGGSSLDPDGYETALNRKRTSRGHDLDELVWLESMIANEAGVGESVRQKLRMAINSLSCQIYGSAAADLGVDPLNIEILRRKVLRGDRFLAMEAPHAGTVGDVGLRADTVRDRVDDPADRLRAADLLVAEVATRRAMRTKTHPVHVDLRGVLGLVQERLVETIVARGLVIETNPSSNLRMQALHRPRELPLIDLMRREDGPRITICTDNPGTFDVSVSCEYALVLEGLMDGPGGLKRDAAFARLEAMRRVGMETELRGPRPCQRPCQEPIAERPGPAAGDDRRDSP